MKNNKLNQKLYQQQEQLRLKELHEKMLNESLVNPLLKRYEELPDYFRTWRREAELVAVIPALNPDDERARSYYSVGTIQNGEEDKRIRVSPVFMYINEEYFDSTTNNYHPHIKCFTFDSEESKLYSYEKTKHSQDYHYVKKDNYEEIKAYIISHPVVLYFQGCDDGHVGKRFKTKEEAFEYIQLLDVFEDVFDEDLEYHN
jgi:hypothetical protein